MAWSIFLLLAPVEPEDVKLARLAAEFLAIALGLDVVDPLVPVHVSGVRHLLLFLGEAALLDFEGAAFESVAAQVVHFYQRRVRGASGTCEAHFRENVLVDAIHSACLGLLAALGALVACFFLLQRLDEALLVENLVALVTGDGRGQVDDEEADRADEVGFHNGAVFLADVDRRDPLDFHLLLSDGGHLRLDPVNEILCAGFELTLGGSVPRTVGYHFYFGL